MEAAEVAAAVGKVAERLYADDEHEGIAEESVAEVMRWLELEIKLAAGAAELQLPPLPAAAASAPYATVGGGTESCGSSLSGPACTVMAAVDGRSAAAAPPHQQAAVPWPWPWPFPEPETRIEEEQDDVDDEWVSQLLTDGPAVEGQCDGQ
ncbi:unnamed protein product [Urochloa decumbens]|uniref:Uncharacterized protein n=1 Tax=Urochloa decumbens TaxID=240449 RepID=A0ABC8W500_9POAL